MLTEEWRQTSRIMALCRKFQYIHCKNGSFSTQRIRASLGCARLFPPHSIGQHTDTVTRQPRSARNIRQSIRFLLAARARYVVGLETIQGIWQYADRLFLCMECSMS